MSISLNSLVLIVVLIVCCIMPILYSIVITLLFICGKREIMIIQDEYKDLRELTDRKIKRLEGQADRKKGTVGFAVPEEKGEASEEAEPDGKEVA
ncbi:MAG: hypothetical protein IKI01_06885 [Lachnospiraceae bacterium]|nr:hypothetical protein [Lachnospiraceae bacterium]